MDPQPNLPLNNNPGQPSTLANSGNRPQNAQGILQQTIRKYTRWLAVITLLVMGWDLIFVEYFCLFEFACRPDGVELKKWMADSLAAIFFITLFLGTCCYYVTQKGDRNGIYFFGFLNIFYIVILFALAIASFVNTGASTSDMNSVWAMLSEQDKIFLESLDNLTSINKTNSTLHGVFMVILGVLFILLDIILYHYYHAVPQNMRRDPDITSRITFAPNSLMKIKKKSYKGPDPYIFS